MLMPMSPPRETGVDLSAEAAIDREIAKIAEWLAAQPADFGSGGSDPRIRAAEGQRDGYYWRSGYFAGLKRALALLSSRGATLH